MNSLTEPSATRQAALFGVPGMGDNYRVRDPNAP